MKNYKNVTIFAVLVVLLVTTLAGSSALAEGIPTNQTGGFDQAPRTAIVSASARSCSPSWHRPALIRR